MVEWKRHRVNIGALEPVLRHDHKIWTYAWKIRLKTHENANCVKFTSRENYQRMLTAARSGLNTNWRRNIQIKRNKVKRLDVTRGRRIRAMVRHNQDLPRYPTAQPSAHVANLSCSPTWFDCKHLRANVNVLCEVCGREKVFVCKQEEKLADKKLT